MLPKAIWGQSSWGQPEEPALLSAVIMKTITTLSYVRFSPPSFEFPGLYLGTTRSASSLPASELEQREAEREGERGIERKRTWYLRKCPVGETENSKHAYGDEG